MCIDSVNVDFVLVGCICNLFCVVNNMLDEKGCLSALKLFWDFFIFHVITIVNCFASALRTFPVYRPPISNLVDICLYFCLLYH